MLAVVSILSAHRQRLGCSRVIAGALLLYSVAPVTVLTHLLLWPIHYIFNFFQSNQPLKLRDYIIIDRYLIKQLHWLDKIGCMYCALVNGSAYYLEQILMHRLDRKTHVCHIWGSVRKTVYLLYFIPLTVKNIAARKLILEPFLKIYRVYQPYSDSVPKDQSWLLTEYKKFRHVLSLTEKTACPIKHLQRTGAVFPPHHDAFYDRDHLEEMAASLRTQ